MKRILVPTDFSPTAEKAFRFAIDLADRIKASVLLYHNFIPVESSFVASEVSREQYNAECEEKIIKRLNRLKKKVLANPSTVTVSAIVGQSPLVDNMLDFANHNQIDLIIMGTQGATGLGKKLLGSVATRDIEKTELPLLLVPAKYELEIPKKFVLATNYQPTDQKALALVDTMAKAYDAEVTILHIINAYMTESAKATEKSHFDSYASSLKPDFSESKIKFQLLETTLISETMETLEKSCPYDIMTMVRRKRTFIESFFLKSFTKKMAYLIKKPFLIIPDE